MSTTETQEGLGPDRRRGWRRGRVVRDPFPEMDVIDHNNNVRASVEGEAGFVEVDDYRQGVPSGFPGKVSLLMGHGDFGKFGAIMSPDAARELARRLVLHAGETELPRS